MAVGVGVGVSIGVADAGVITVVDVYRLCMP
jgi:hypothetical protein